MPEIKPEPQDGVCSRRKMEPQDGKQPDGEMHETDTELSD
ncbi:hypothetical protein BRYFOR_09362 [Marvinbryantia formatexigens DSM 14469]|uniref:Uncharacterized protein n=1 Tax=Marvinbryantia formatexigens DSM 14469 TaxID=478749 RepID=C6LL15_9FIRM|nr:hypothetical protein BRYFOR_09362 [Marvinbryantia formatexigens DSM 14469]